MAKKAKRQVSFNTSSGEAAVIRPRLGGVRPGTSEFDPDYTYVKNDLKNFFIQMAGFVGILIILTFFLR